MLNKVKINQLSNRKYHSINTNIEADKDKSDDNEMTCDIIEKIVNLKVPVPGSSKLRPN